MPERKAIIQGNYKHLSFEQHFRGTISFELREDCVYYLIQLESVDGKSLGERGYPVPFRTIPKSIDPYEFALNHAIEAIRRTRINRRKPFEVTSWNWT